MKKDYARAKRVDNDEWLYGYYLYVEEQNKHYILTGKLKNYPVDCAHPTLAVQGFEWFEVKEETVCSFLGATDNAEQEIYGGDIIKDADGREYIICYDNHGCFLCYDMWTNMLNEGGIGVVVRNGKKLSEIKDPIVIGNIFDNEELTCNARN